MVPARKKIMDLEALLRALDQNRTLRDEARWQGIIMPGDEIHSLRELALDCKQRVKVAPMEMKDEF